MKYLALICTVLASPVALACATCSGPADAPQSQGMNAAILTLFCILGIVALTVTGFVAAIALRIARHQPEETAAATPPPSSQPLAGSLS